jgi:DNA-binding NtrC family response regulator
MRNQETILFVDGGSHAADSFAAVLGSVPKSAGESKVSSNLPGGASSKPLGVSAGWRDVVKSVANAAAGNEPVLVVGEAGTGKEEVARMLHRSSARNKGPFVRLNCFDLSVDSLEAGFATHRRGMRASTEAGFEGVFQAARTGTLFLHAVNFLSEAAQSQILRILRDRGSDSEEVHPSPSADVRMVASCSVDLEASVAAGNFSRDLFNEINRMTILVPPLRERVEDIQFLAAAFLEEFASILRKPARSFHPEAMALLESYRWPGNVRELRNVIERAVLLSETAAIPTACLPLNPDVDSSVGSRHDLNLRSVLAAEEKRTLIEALQRAHGVRREAARLLGIDPRNLVYFLRKYGLEKREER